MCLIQGNKNEKKIHRCVLWMPVQVAAFQCLSTHQFVSDVADGGVINGLGGEVD